MSGLLIYRAGEDDGRVAGGERERTVLVEPSVDRLRLKRAKRGAKKMAAAAPSKCLRLVTIFYNVRRTRREFRPTPIASARWQTSNGLDLFRI